MQFRIKKDFEFDYGHRVWTQKLNSEYSLDNSCKCKHLHGHRGVVSIIMQSDKALDALDDSGMVTDFKHLNWFKQFIDDVLDHKMIIDVDDKGFREMIPGPMPVMMSFNNEYNYYFTNPQHAGYTIQKPEVKEILDGIVLVNFVPTSENLCQWFYRITAPKMKKLGVKVVGVEFKETPKSYSYYGE